MEIIKLPVQKPLINTYQHHAFPISIAMNHPDFMNWFCSNYLQISFPKQESMNPLNYYSFLDYFVLCPLIERFYIEKELVLNTSNSHEFFIDAIDRKLYAITFIDEYYVPYTEPHMNWHVLHDILIFGYDSSARSFFSSGFSKDRKYSTEQKLSFSNFNQAVNVVEEIDRGKNYSEWTNKVNLLRVKYDSNYKFHVSALKESANDYLSSTNSSYRYSIFRDPNDHAYGLEVYSILDNILSTIPDQIDIRMFHLIWEHKKNMNIRIDFLTNNQNFKLNKDLKNKFNKIESDSLINKNLAMKYNLIHDVKLLSSIRENMKKLMNSEAEVFYELLRNL